MVLSLEEGLVGSMAARASVSVQPAHAVISQLTHGILPQVWNLREDSDCELETLATENGWCSEAQVLWLFRSLPAGS